MGKGRLEAFSDGVIAIIITIMVLELRPPHGDDLSSLAPLLPVFASYALSFVFVGIYWNNHHHMIHAASKVNGAILWANLHLLFWLSMIPFVTAWLGGGHFKSLPVACYGVVMLMSGVAYFILSRAIIAHHGSESTLAKAVGGDCKGWLSLALYAAAIPLSFVSPWIGAAIYVGVALMWFVPDQRIERTLGMKA